MESNKKFFSLLTMVLILVIALTSCGVLESQPGQLTAGPSEPQPTDAPPEPAPTDPPSEPEPTEAPAEPEATPVPTQLPSEGEEESIVEDDLVKILVALVIVFVIIGVVILVASRRRGKSEEQSVEPESAPITVDDLLNNATPRAAELYKRFDELVHSFGVVTVVPAQTRIDFQARLIFASVEFLEDNLWVNLVLPHRLDSPRIIRVDTYSQSSFANYMYINTLDDYDAEFSTWLQEAYSLGAS